jgi:hypothetical protein
MNMNAMTTPVIRSGLDRRLDKITRISNKDFRQPNTAVRAWAQVRNWGAPGESGLRLRRHDDARWLAVARESSTKIAGSCQGWFGMTPRLRTLSSRAGSRGIANSSRTVGTRSTWPGLPTVGVEPGRGSELLDAYRGPPRGAVVLTVRQRHLAHDTISSSEST